MRKQLISVPLLFTILLFGVMLHASDRPHKKAVIQTPHSPVKNAVVHTKAALPSPFDGLTPHVLLF